VRPPTVAGLYSRLRAWHPHAAALPTAVQRSLLSASEPQGGMTFRRSKAVRTAPGGLAAPVHAGMKCPVPRRTSGPTARQRSGIAAIACRRCGNGHDVPVFRQRTCLFHMKCNCRVTVTPRLITVINSRRCWSEHMRVTPVRTVMTARLKACSRSREGTGPRHGGKANSNRPLRGTCLLFRAQG